jgi:hypothetical protein
MRIKTGNYFNAVIDFALPSKRQMQDTIFFNLMLKDEVLFSKPMLREDCNLQTLSLIFSAAEEIYRLNLQLPMYIGTQITAMV